MTKEEYQDFILRYKGCGACFPMYHTLSRFEKMWFSAIQKDVAQLEKENAELKERYNGVNVIGYDALENFTEAKERIRALLFHLTADTFYVTFETKEQSIERARQLLRGNKINDEKQLIKEKLLDASQKEKLAEWKKEHRND